MKRTPRSIRYLIQNGTLPAKREGRRWIIRYEDLVLGPEVADQEAKKRARLLDVAAKALDTGSREIKAANSSRKKPRSLSDLDAWNKALALHSLLEQVHGDSDGKRKSITGKALLGTSRQALVHLAQGHFHYAPSLKRGAWNRAREGFVEVLVGLSLTSRPRAKGEAVPKITLLER